jgi:hypothetical protein
MKNSQKLRALLGMVCVFAFNGQTLSAQQKAPSSSAQVHVVITDMAVRTDSELPRLRPGEVMVKQGKTLLQVTQLIPAQGDNATLQLSFPPDFWSGFWRNPKEFYESASS